MKATAQIRAAQERPADSVASAAPLRIDPIGGSRVWAQRIAGHSDIKVTMMVYAHGRLDEKAAALTQLGDALAAGLMSAVDVTAAAKRSKPRPDQRRDLRKRRDSNPRTLSGLSLSRRVHSAALPRFREIA